MRRVHWIAYLAALALALAACDSDDDGGGLPTVDASGDEGGGARDGTGGDTPAPGEDATEDTTLEPTPCTTDDQCDGLATGACRGAVCGNDGVCVIGDLPDGTPCDTDVCLQEQACADGACGGGAPTPAQCDGRECGEDGCGNSCGTCSGEETCNEAGQCTTGGDPAWSCDELSFEGCCTDQGAVVWCEEGQVQQLECFADGGTCGWNGEEGFFDCAAEEMGDPGGSVPYLCPGEACSESCAERECGYACGEACGTCGEGQVCDAGQCVACSCDGKACGDDGCGDSCGACGEGEFCEANQCEVCSCEGLECGENACGESCGTCGDGQACTAEGQCVADPCEGVTVVGCCDGSTLWFCSEGQLGSEQCEGSCGWDPEGADGQGWYDCGATGTDPNGEFPLECPHVDPPPPVDEEPEFVEPVPDVVEDVPDVQDGEVVDTETIEDIDVGPTPDEGPVPDTDVGVTPDTAPDTDVDVTPDTDADTAPDTAPDTDVDDF
ncbi:MAG: hypothetical protein ACQEXJ_07355 [Myxococcota bacterium]